MSCDRERANGGARGHTTATRKGHAASASASARVHSKKSGVLDSWCPYTTRRKSSTSSRRQERAPLFQPSPPVRRSHAESLTNCACSSLPLSRPPQHSPEPTRVGSRAGKGMAGDDGSIGSGSGGGGGGIRDREDEVHVQIAGSSKPETSSTNGTAPQNSHTRHWHWWLMVALNIFFLVAGQTASTLLGRFYYNQGGNSKWMSTFVQTAGFPVLFVALYLFRSKSPSTQTTTSNPETSVTKITLIYIVLGLIIAADDLMYSYGLLYLPVSTYSLICASQLAFNAVFSYVLNAQKFTALILNSIYTALVATIASLVGLFASGEWKTLEGEMHAFSSGRLSYVMTLLWTAVSWQIASVGVVGLIFVVSSLFSNVISTLALPIIPVFAVIFFHDKMNGVKIIAMLMAIWGFVSYGYQLYISDKKARKTSVSVEENS
ncbi:hypothetical protein SORBI_3004G277000 [Sorghum bicolor]|uniref:Probable purine permease n=1 Tax=Sorghum bicolor TaxID=4558 RepID=A0A1Z5RQC0_SORBI|nr:hypothetical protein SORBI_3004G277000 [Sorghum bicolor]